MIEEGVLQILRFFASHELNLTVIAPFFAAQSSLEGVMGLEASDHITLLQRGAMAPKSVIRQPCAQIRERGAFSSRWAACEIASSPPTLGD
jgi:hypothetical protein